MIRGLLFSILMAIGFALSGVAESAVVYSTGIESLGETGKFGGTSVDSSQYLGVRFQAGSSFNATEIGGHFGGTPATTIFGAVFQISGPSDVPDLAALEHDTNLIGYSVFGVPRASDVVFSAISGTIQTGHWYALVFGSGLFGAAGDGYTPYVNPSANTGANSFWYVPSTNSLYEPGFSTLGYFELRGEQVPTPGSLALIGAGFLGLTWARRFRRQ